jgi:hypothetical protein
MILIAENREWTTTYPTAPEPVALVDISPVGVVIPLDAVQRGCNANLSRPPRTPGRSRKMNERTRSHVKTLPKNLIAGLHPSGWTREQRRFRRPALPIPVRAGTETGMTESSTTAQHDGVWLCVLLSSLLTREQEKECVTPQVFGSHNCTCIS